MRQVQKPEIIIDINCQKLLIFKIVLPLVFSCLSENLVPNIFLELFFVMQLLTSRSAHPHDDNEKECAANSGLKLFLLAITFHNFSLKIN